MQHSKMKAIIQDFMDILGGSIYEASEEIGFSDRYLWRVYHNKDLISPSTQQKIVDRIEKYSFGCCIEGGSWIICLNRMCMIIQKIPFLRCDYEHNKYIK